MWLLFSEWNDRGRPAGGFYMLMFAASCKDSTLEFSKALDVLSVREEMAKCMVLTWFDVKLLA